VILSQAKQAAQWFGEARLFSNEARHCLGAIIGTSGTMANQDKITDEMDLTEAITLSRTFPLETLINNFQATAEGLVIVWRSAEEALAECPDPQTMPRLLQLLNQELKAQGNSAWFRPIGLRLRNQALPQCEKNLAISTLLPLVDRKTKKDEREPVSAKALDALSQAQPLPAEVVEHCSKKLDHPHYHVAGSALRVLINLPPAERGKWVPLLLKHFDGRFSQNGNSEGTWIIECLAPHFSSHREQIVPVLQAGLKSEHSFIPHSVLAVLHQLGPMIAELVPEVLEYIGRQRSFTNEEPHLFHLDPEGKQAIPGLIRLLDNPQETARYQAVCELEAYGPRAQSAIPALTKLANSGEDQQFSADADAARRAVKVIQQRPHAGRKKSATDRILDLMEKSLNPGSQATDQR
jgi:hypothetical protein